MVEDMYDGGDKSRRRYGDGRLVGNDDGGGYGWWW